MQETPVQEQPKPIDPALQEKLDALKTIVAIDNLISSGLYPGAFSGEVERAKDFLKSIHAPIMAEAQAHPDFVRATKPSSGRNEANVVPLVATSPIGPVSQAPDAQ